MHHNLQPIVTIILCTYNRAPSLRLALQSLVSQSFEKSAYEIVVVDNASTDNTSALIKAFQRDNSSSDITLVVESKQGLAYARNTGCKMARGHYLAFIDDDCIASEDWLQALVDCYEHVKPLPWSVGGPILPRYDSPRPRWFKDSYETDTWGDQPRFLLNGESFTGCNMSFRKEVIEQFGGFDADFGMKGDNLALAEETQLFQKIWSAAGKACNCYYTPRAVVYHTIDPYKMTVAYQLKRAFSSGQASWTMTREHNLIRRLLVCTASAALIAWYTAKAILHIKHGYRQSWMVEQLYPVVSNIGRLLAYLGIRMIFRQRHQTIVCSD